MDERQLNYFISVAEHLNFTRAAQHHYITQTAISQQIMSLEQQLGVTLFNRSSRSVQLTTAGKVFYIEAKLILSQMEEAIKKTRRAFSGMEGNLVIGFTGPYEKDFLPALLKGFGCLYPDINLSLVKKTMDMVREDMERGLIDIVFIPLFGLDVSDKISYIAIRNYAQCAVMYPDHPLAGEAKISRARLADEPFITADRSKVPLAYNQMIRDCASYGFSPNIIHESQSMETVLLMIEAKLGIGLMPEYYKIYASKNLRFIKLEGEEGSVRLVAAWMKDNPNLSIPLFIKILDEQKNTFSAPL